ncbi:MAG: FAD-dependent oxidoreductase [Alphaproteobacteria bacterium]|nr:FAD-dependent oxidoreductase [Alphaproteobacteria bacterium]
MRSLDTTCCIVGGGPAGMMLGYLLARAGVDIVVLEKHADFFRDFRGDTIHPSTLENFHELGLLDEFLKLPHQELTHIEAQIGDETFPAADFTHLPTRCKFVAFMPQWDFLDFVAEQARKRKTFRLLMETEGLDLLRDGERVTGVRARGPDGEVEIKAPLTVAADGRHSTIRAASGLQVMDFGAPMDVLWLRLSKRPGEKSESFGRAIPGRLIILIDRGDYWQCAFVIAKGTFDEMRKRDIGELHAELARAIPGLSDRIGEIKSWDDAKLLTVAVDRLKQWHLPGLLCIGDAAHAMSPVGGIGINLAIQDAVATANILASSLRKGRLRDQDLAAVQKRRERPARVTQDVQLFIQRRLIRAILKAKRRVPVPFPLKVLRAIPYLRRFPARFVGLGVQPEHVRSRDDRATLRR